MDDYFQVKMKNTGKYGIQEGVDATPQRTVVVSASSLNHAKAKAEWQNPGFRAESVTEKFTS